MPNKMTQETKKRLEAELQKLEKQYKEAGQKLGEAFGPDCDWHDNFDADAATEEYKRIGFLESQTRAKLEDVEIIKPRTATNAVNIGNTVLVKLGNSAQEIRFTILGPDDAGTGRDRGWISYETPVGKALLGMKKGEIKEFELGQGTKQTVEVKEILRGEFV